jgi:hypothetical protein
MKRLNLNHILYYKKTCSDFSNVVGGHITNRNCAFFEGWAFPET